MEPGFLHSAAITIMIRRERVPIFRVNMVQGLNMKHNIRIPVPRDDSDLPAHHIAGHSVESQGYMASMDRQQSA